VHCAYDFALRFGVNPVRKLGQMFIKPPPEREAVCDRWWCRDWADGGDVLVADDTVDAACFNQAALQPGGCLAKAHEHECSPITAANPGHLLGILKQTTQFSGS
jgi:hypothetical protein